jgi:hypothetical protein
VSAQATAVIDCFAEAADAFEELSRERAAPSSDRLPCLANARAHALHCLRALRPHVEESVPEGILKTPDVDLLLARLEARAEASDDVDVTAARCEVVAEGLRARELLRAFDDMGVRAPNPPLVIVRLNNAQQAFMELCGAHRALETAMFCASMASPINKTVPSISLRFIGGEVRRLGAARVAALAALEGLRPHLGTVPITVKEGDLEQLTLTLHANLETAALAELWSLAFYGQSLRASQGVLRAAIDLLARSKGRG